MGGTTWIRSLVLAGSFLTATSSAYGASISGGGGVFVPFEGNSGFNGLLRILGSPSESFGVGAELEYRNFESSFFGVHDVEINKFDLRAIGKYTFFPGHVSPYLGAGLGLGVNVIDAGRVEDERDDIKVFNDVGVGVGVLGLAGVEVPLGDHLALFAEGRVSGDFQLTDAGDVDVENIGGFSGVGGLEIRF